MRNGKVFVGRIVLQRIGRVGRIKVSANGRKAEAKDRG